MVKVLKKVKILWLLFVAVIFVIGISGCLRNRNNRSEETFTPVPNVMGMNYSDAVTVLENAGFDVTAVEADASTILPYTGYSRHNRTVLQGQVFRVNDETDPNYKDNNKYSRISTDNRVVVTYALSDYIYEKPTDDKNDFESEMDEKEFSDETPKLTSSTEPKTFEELSEAIEAAKTVYYNATKEAEVLFYQAVNDDSFDIFSRALDDSLAKYDDEAESLFKYVDAFNEQLYEDDKIDYKSYFDFYTETYKLYSDSYTEIYKAYSDAYSASLNALFNGIVQASPVTPTNAPGGNTEAPKTSNSEWKEFLKLYEEWVDDYVKLLNKYNDNPLDMSILFDYIESIQKMAEWSEKADKIQSDLSGDDLIEYLAAMARIIQKLGQVN